jgi:hypothetical protein
MRSKPIVFKRVSITIKGVTHSGTYYVQDKMVRVQSAYGDTETQVGGLSPEGIARVLLSELIRNSTVNPIPTRAKTSPC